MEIKYQNITLRHYRADDIEDWVRWHTVQTEWAFWDSPDMEPMEFDEVAYRAERRAMLEAMTADPPSGFQWCLEVDADGVHIGVVNAYLLDEHDQWVPYWDIPEGTKLRHFVGLEIFEPAYWSRGYGAKMLAAYIGHMREHGISDIYLETWSGNHRMMRCAEKLGFAECGRVTGNRHVNGTDYDTVTYRLNAVVIRRGGITLRDMRESDIDDEIRWNTVETEWALWDAPWEMEAELAKFDPVVHRRKCMEDLRRMPDPIRWRFEIDTADGTHIGSVNAYLIDENWDWIPAREVQPGQKIYRTLGIEINESRNWGRGLGTQALVAFIQYHLESGITDLCLQTWSGNERMVRCARKLGFVECHREVGNRHVRGGIYDGLTFRLDVEKFRSGYGNPV